MKSTAVAPCRTLRRAPALVAALAVVASLAGCSVCQQARRTLLFEPLHFGWKLDRARSLRTYRAWAADAWRAERAACPEAAASRYYAEGFRDGFVDFIYVGGDGQPPPIPPRKYWNMAWRGPAGQAAAQQWFAGFRRGAQAARDGGYRQLATVQSSYRIGPHDLWDEPALGPLDEPTEDAGPPGEQLPTPTPTLPDQPTDNEAPEDQFLPPAPPEAPDAPMELPEPEGGATPAAPDDDAT